MGEVIQIYRSNPLEWIRQNAPFLTMEFAGRYGISLEDARRTLKDYERDGYVRCRRVRMEWGAALQWELCDESVKRRRG